MDQTEQQAAVNALDSEVEEVRHQAVKRLAEAFGQVPVEVLLKALGDDGWRVRKAATHLALESTVTPKLLEALAGAVGEQDNAGLRNAATEVLIRIGRAAVPVVVGLMRSADRDERKIAADILGEIGLPESVDALLAGLKDADDNVRAASAEALGRTGDQRAVEPLLESLRTDNLLMQLSCLDALDRVRAQVPPELLQRLSGVRPLRPLVFRLIGAQRDRQAVERLMPLLYEGLASRGRAERSAAALAVLHQYRQADRQGRAEIRASVSRLATDELCERLRESLRHSQGAERQAVIAVLGWTGRTEVVAELIRVAADERFRQEVAKSILAIGPASAEVLAGLIHDIGRAEKMLAVELLGHFQQPASLPAIVEMSLSQESVVAEAAQRALGQLGDPSVVPTLVDLLDRSGATLVSGAVASLILLGDRFRDEVVSRVSPLLSSDRPQTRAAAAEVLCGAARRGDQQQLERLTGDQDPKVRAVAIGALGRVGGDDVIDRLRMVLADESCEVRAAAAKALGNRTGPKARSALRVALSDPDAQVVIEALAGLGHSGGEEAVQAILPFAEHPNGAVALEAVKALNRLGWGDDPECPLSTCRHPDPEVVKEVLSGCDRWPLPVARAALRDALHDTRWDLRMAAVKKIDAMRDSHGMHMLVERLPAERDPLVKEAMERILRLNGMTEHS